jgi:hypothetical protein
MAARAAARAAARPHPDADAIAAFVAERGAHVLSVDPPPSDVDPGVCRQCCVWKPVWPGVHWWFQECGSPCAYGHDGGHHAQEIWLAGGA